MKLARCATPAAVFVSLASPLMAQAWENCTPLQTWNGEAPGDQFGWVGVNAGDVTGDGVADALIGAPFNDAGGMSAGRAYLYDPVTGALVHTLETAGSLTAGYAVAGAGDVDGDGVRDLIVGAPALGSTMPGNAYIYSGLDGSLIRTLTGEAAGDQFGYAVGGGHDVDGDTVPDVVIGAPNHDAVASNAGRAYVYSGADGSIIQQWDGEAINDVFGRGVDIIGDRNADLRSEVLVGAPGAGPANRGRAYLFEGVDGSNPCTLDADPMFGNGFGQYFVGFAGDVDNDDTLDFFVCDFSSTFLGGGTGSAHVYSGVDCSEIHTLTGQKFGEGYGIGRGWVGDVNGDGHDDLLFGSWSSSDGAAGATGKIDIRSGADGSLLGKFTGDIQGASLGFDVAGLGDVDGDGRPDYFPTAAQNAGFTGAAYVFSAAPDPPANYCLTAPNSVGTGAVITYRQSLSIAANVFTLRTTGAPAGNSALYYYGTQEGAVPFGEGTRCVLGDVFRLGSVAVVDASGMLDRALDFTQLAGAAAIPAGATRSFQLWYRDPTGGPSGVNLSDGLRVTFCP